MTDNQIKQHLQTVYDTAEENAQTGTMYLPYVKYCQALKTRLRRLYVAYEEGVISIDDLLAITV